LARPVARLGAALDHFRTDRADRAHPRLRRGVTPAVPPPDRRPCHSLVRAARRLVARLLRLLFRAHEPDMRRSHWARTVNSRPPSTNRVMGAPAHRPWSLRPRTLQPVRPG